MRVHFNRFVVVVQIISDALLGNVWIQSTVHNKDGQAPTIGYGMGCDHRTWALWTKNIWQGCQSKRSWVHKGTGVKSQGSHGSQWYHNISTRLGAVPHGTCGAEIVYGQWNSGSRLAVKFSWLERNRELLEYDEEKSGGISSNLRNWSQECSQTSVDYRDHSWLLQNSGSKYAE